MEGITEPPNSPGRSTRTRIALALLVLLLGGCAGIPQEIAESEKGATCAQQFQQLDERVEAGSTRDAGDTRIDGFPWLRINRFLASRLPAETDEQAWEAWLEALRQLDLEGRRYELANLHGIEPEHPQLQAMLAPLEDCGRELNQKILASTGLRGKLTEQARVPDDYRRSQRWLGAYPISRWFVLAGVARLHADQKDWLGQEHEAGPGALALRYAGTGLPAPETTIQDIPRDPLGRPKPTPAQERELFRQHAPVWEIHTESRADRIGQPRWRGNPRPEVDTDQPVEYRFLSRAEFDGEAVLQLNYMVWLPERPPREGWLDRLLAGHMDGLIWRITLDGEGRVLAGESLHACGCYYMVFPGSGLTPRGDRPGGEPVFMGPPLPERPDSEQLVLVREPSSHYLLGIDTIRREREREPLAVRPADSLRSLPDADGRRSLYGTDGIVPGTQRPERWLLWPMGIRSAGAMRQPGRHAIAFAGIRHFDDPDLLDNHFRRKDPE